MLQEKQSDRLASDHSFCSTYMTKLPPDIKSQEVGPGEDVVATHHHSHIRHKDVLQGQKKSATVSCGFRCLLSAMSQPTLMQPTMEVVRAELYCVHSMMAYIKTKLQSRERVRWGVVFFLSSGTEKNCELSRQVVLPHDTGEHKLDQEHRVGPAVKR